MSRVSFTKLDRPRARPSIHSDSMNVSRSPEKSPKYSKSDFSKSTNESEEDFSSQYLDATFERSNETELKESESSDTEEEEVDVDCNKPSINDTNQTTNWITILLPILLVLSVGLGLAYVDRSPETFDFQTIKERFPTQNEDLWVAFESGVQDVVTRNRPSTFILLYQEEAEKTVKELVEQLSQYAICNITQCSNQPIVLTEGELNSPEVIRDYGSLIEKYRDKLGKNGVMIIKNLENVRGVSAQAFHTFCDEFTPLVDRSLFIFTMKVKELQPDSMKFVDQYFRSKWTDIKSDTFNALITRITSMVLEVVP